MITDLERFDIEIDRPGYDPKFPWRVRAEWCTRGWFATREAAFEFAAELITEQKALGYFGKHCDDGADRGTAGGQET